MDVIITKTTSGYNLHVNGHLQIEEESYYVVNTVADMLHFGADSTTELGEVTLAILNQCSSHGTE